MRWLLIGCIVAYRRRGAGSASALEDTRACVATRCRQTLVVGVWHWNEADSRDAGPEPSERAAATLLPGTAWRFQYEVRLHMGWVSQQLHSD